MKKVLLTMAIACSVAAQAQKAPVFETSAKDEIAWRGVTIWTMTVN